MTKKTLLLVDGSSYLYRAFHALPDMRSPDGDPTGAVYGMVAMLRRLRQDSKLTGLTEEEMPFGAVIFDAPGKTFRDDIFAEYKATRSATPDDLKKQIPIIHDIVRAMGWPLIMVSGVEADDVIGTLAVRASAAGLKTLVSTGDKDLAQLVNADVELVNTMSRDGQPAERLDIEGVKTKFGVPPDRIIDYLTLMGDTVDNVPGVEKVGPKTAAKWIAQYGSLDALVAQAADVGGAVGENLRKALTWLPTGKTLVTVKLDCDLEGHVGPVESLALKPEAKEELRTYFTKCGFKTWLKEVSVGAALPAGESGDLFSTTNPVQASAAHLPVAPALAFDVEYECVSTQAQLDTWLAKINAAPLTAIDTETTSLDEMVAELVGISLSVEAGKACYIPVGHTYAGASDQLSRDHVLAFLRPWMTDASKKKVGQHLKYDVHVLQNYGVTLAGIEHDTLLQSYVLEAHKSHDMGSLAKRHLNRDSISYESVAGKGAGQITFDQVSIDIATKYSSEDAEITMHLHNTLYPQIAADEKLKMIYEKIELPSARVLQIIERNGVLIDGPLLIKQGDELGIKLIELEGKAHEAAGQPFNLGSPKQLGEILFEKMKLPIVKKTATGAPSTDEEVLAKLAEDYPLPKLVLESRGLSKLKSTYTDKLPKMVNVKTGRVHTHYLQAVAVTGRLASSDPNLQNIPIRTAEGRRIREAFIAPPGCSLMSADYSQIELRIMAHISEDASLMRAFEQGIDVHRATASEIFGVPTEEVDSEQRRYAKVINFGLIYGMSAFGLASSLGIDRQDAKNYIERYFARYPGVAKYMEQTRVLAKQQGYVETVFGRRLWLAEINSPNGPRRAGAERAAINAPMQGTAADLIKLAMVGVQDWLDSPEGLVAKGTKMIMQVHDELVLEVPDEHIDLVKSQVKRIMENVAPLKVPLEVGIGVGLNWDTAH
jgi:DNA polymerase I